MAYTVADIPNYSACGQQIWDSLPPDVRRWKGIVNLYMPFHLVMKFLYTIKYESAGNPYAEGDGGVAIGLLQIQDKTRFPDRPTKRELLIPHININYAASVLRARENNFQAWGENALYQGRPFGALGNHPYPCGGEILGPTPSYPTAKQIVEAYPTRALLDTALAYMYGIPYLQAQREAMMREIGVIPIPPPSIPPTPQPQPEPGPGDGGGIDIDIPIIDWGNDLLGFVDKFNDFIQDVTGFIEDKLNVDVSGLVGSITDKVDGIIDAITDKVDAVAKPIGNALEAISDNIGSGIRTVLSSIEGIAGVVESGVRFGTTQITNAIDRIYDGVEATLGPALDKISDLMETVIDGTVAGAVGLANAAVDALTDATTGAIGVIDDVIDGFVSIVDSIADGVVEGIEKAVTGVTAGVDSIAGFLSDTLPELLRGLGANIGDIAEGVIDLPVALGSAMVSSLFGIVSGAVDTVDDLTGILPRAEFERLI